MGVRLNLTFKADYCFRHIRPREGLTHDVALQLRL